MKINRYWFVPKKFGWGYVPVTREGWVVTAVIVLLVWFSGYINHIMEGTTNPKDYLAFIFDVILVILISLPICDCRTQGKTKWRWGR